MGPEARFLFPLRILAENKLGNTKRLQRSLTYVCIPGMQDSQGTQHAALGDLIHLNIVPGPRDILIYFLFLSEARFFLYFLRLTYKSVMQCGLGAHLLLGVLSVTLLAF